MTVGMGPARAFGPVPSRRLGRSLGLNNIPAKTCSYGCVYCQAGRTLRSRIAREPFYDPMAVLAEVRGRLAAADEAGDHVDYITFVAEGEPTLDAGLGLKIDLIKSLGRKVAVISNGSLLWKEDVRQDLAKADWVSLKVDSVRDGVWRAVNRPNGGLKLGEVLQGQQAFAGTYKGRLVTETMLVSGVNDGLELVQETAGFVASLKPAQAYISVPIRPPAWEHIQAPDAATISACAGVFTREGISVEVLAGPESGTFFSGGDVEGDLLGITAVHPMRERDVRALAAKAGAAWAVVEKLVAEGKLIETLRGGERFYSKRRGG
jgi:wyosine [tRNA(Phe)-imidazoG37] synthetase (radical SAM superfamily)